MPTPAQSQAISNAIASIRAAENVLLNQGRLTTDPLVAAKISNEYNSLDSVLTQLIQAQVISDDATFQRAATALQQESAVLNAQANAISQIIKDVGTAAQIAGYITQAATALASLI
jgi:hypothetical protein